MLLIPILSHILLHSRCQGLRLSPDISLLLVERSLLGSLSSSCASGVCGAVLGGLRIRAWLHPPAEHIRDLRSDPVLSAGALNGHPLPQGNLAARNLRHCLLCIPCATSLCVSDDARRSWGPSLRATYEGVWHLLDNAQRIEEATGGVFWGAGAERSMVPIISGGGRLVEVGAGAGSHSNGRCSGGGRIWYLGIVLCARSLRALLHLCGAGHRRRGACSPMTPLQIHSLHSGKPLTLVVQRVHSDA